MKCRWIIGLLILTSLAPRAAQAQGTETGAAIGGIGGALAGAAIGKNNHNTAGGALLGGAVGLIAGSAIGNSVDQKNRNLAYQQSVAQQQAYQQQVQAYNMSRAASSGDIISMSRNGLGDDVIINHIRQNGVQRRPDVNEVIMLHNQGVKENVIAAMQQAPEGGPAAAPSLPPAPPATAVYAAPPPPVIVSDYYYGRPYYYGPHPHYHYRYYGPPPRPAPGVHWGITIGR